MVSKSLVSRKSKPRPLNSGQKYVPRTTAKARAAAAMAAAAAAAAQAKKERRRGNNLRRLWDKMVSLKRPAKGAALKKPEDPSSKKSRLQPQPKPRNQPPPSPHTQAFAKAPTQTTTCSSTAFPVFPSSLRPPAPPPAPPSSVTRTLIFDEQEDDQQDERQFDQQDERLLPLTAPIGGSNSRAALSNVLDSDAARVTYVEERLAVVESYLAELRAVLRSIRRE